VIDIIVCDSSLQSPGGSLSFEADRYTPSGGE
jgi:hypothetical protein